MVPELEKEHPSNVSRPNTEQFDQKMSLDLSGQTDEAEQKQNWLVAWARNSEGSSAWYLLFRVFIFNTLTGINFVIFGLLYVEYSIYFEEPKAVLGLIRSFEMGATVLGSLFMSWPIERFGYPRMSFIGSMISVVGLISASFATTTVMLYLTQGVLGGFGYGITYLCAPIVVQRHFHNNRALANGIISVGYSFGNMIGPMITKVLIDNYGWRGTLLLTGGMSLNMAAIGITFRVPSNKKPRDKTLQHGFMEAIKKTLDFSLLKNKPFTLFLIACFLQSFQMCAFMNFTPLRAVHAGISIDGAAFLSTVTFIASTSMRVLIVFVSNIECVDYNLLFAFGTLLGVPGIIFTLFMPGFNGSLVGCIVSGMSIGCATTLYPLIVLELCGLEYLVRGLAVFTLFAGSSALASTPFCGWLFDITGDYDLAFMMMGCACGLGCLLSIIVYIINRRVQSRSPETEQDLMERSVLDVKE